MSNDPIQATLEQDYIEDQITLEAGGHRLTLFVQVVPNKMIPADPDEFDRLQTLINIWLAFQNLKRFGKARL